MMSSRSASAPEIAGKSALRRLAPQRHSSNPGRNERNGFMHPGQRESSDLLWTGHPVMSANLINGVQIEVKAGSYFSLCGIAAFSRLLGRKTDTQIGTHLDVGVNFWQQLVRLRHSVQTPDDHESRQR